MPLSFESESHGNIAFGFFNIESDMLLLENFFFFADDFCQWMTQIAQLDENAPIKFEYQIYCIVNPNDIGDLMGAIHGIRFTGFIGKIYTLFPFPEDPNDFKQNTEGYKTRQLIKSEIEQFATTIQISFEFNNKREIKLGEYLFDINVFHELIRYVWHGGYPRWKKDEMPVYVSKMKEMVQRSENLIFQGI